MLVICFSAWPTDTRGGRNSFSLVMTLAFVILILKVTSKIFDLLVVLQRKMDQIRRR